MALENATVNMETMNAMKTGAEAMKVVHGKMFALFPCSEWSVFLTISQEHR